MASGFVTCVSRACTDIIITTPSAVDNIRIRTMYLYGYGVVLVDKAKRKVAFSGYSKKLSRHRGEVS